MLTHRTRKYDLLRFSLMPRSASKLEQMRFMQKYNTIHLCWLVSWLVEIVVFGHYLDKLYELGVIEAFTTLTQRLFLD
jgi:hypothetical protein